MLRLPVLPLAAWPFPHVTSKQFFSVDRYEQLVSSFPVCPPASGPTGFSYFRGDPQYDSLVEENEAWKWFHESVQSQAFVSHCLEQFSSVWKSSGCVINLNRARYVDYVESRADKERRHIQNPAFAPEELWVRLDIAQARVGYRRGPHLDHRRRLLTMLIYFCDARENTMVGGELHLHSPAMKTGQQPPIAGTIAPEHNSMVAFACTPNSVHSVSEIKSQVAPRNFVQITISSSVDAWII